MLCGFFTASEMSGFENTTKITSVTHIIRERGHAKFIPMNAVVLVLREVCCLVGAALTIRRLSHQS